MNARKNKKILLLFAPPSHTEVIVQFLPGEQKKRKDLTKMKTQLPVTYKKYRHTNK